MFYLLSSPAAVGTRRKGATGCSSKSGRQKELLSARNVPHVLEPLAYADSVSEIENALLGIVRRLGFENFCMEQALVRASITRAGAMSSRPCRASGLSAT